MCKSMQCGSVEKLSFVRHSVNNVLVRCPACLLENHLSTHPWHYSPFRALASLRSCLHSSLFSAFLLYPRVPNITTCFYGIRKLRSGGGSVDVRHALKKCWHEQHSARAVAAGVGISATRGQNWFTRQQHWKGKYLLKCRCWARVEFYREHWGWLWMAVLDAIDVVNSVMADKCVRKLGECKTVV